VYAPTPVCMYVCMYAYRCRSGSGSWQARSGASSRSSPTSRPGPAPRCVNKRWVLGISQPNERATPHLSIDRIRLYQRHPQDYALSHLPLGQGLAGMECHTGISLCSKLCDEFGHLHGYYGACVPACVELRVYVCMHVASFLTSYKHTHTHSLTHSLTHTLYQVPAACWAPRPSAPPSCRYVRYVTYLFIRTSPFIITQRL
jgi:hypothetical protein